MKVNAAKDTASRLKALGAIRPGDIGLDIPQNGEPRTRLSMGEHAALTALEWRITREAQDELAARSHHNLARSYDEGFHDDLSRRSAASSATTTCAPTPRSRSSPPSSRSSARARPPR